MRTRCTGRYALFVKNDCCLRKERVGLYLAQLHAQLSSGAFGWTAMCNEVWRLPISGRLYTAFEEVSARGSDVPVYDDMMMKKPL
jgi:hypothetical protein